MSDLDWDSPLPDSNTEYSERLRNDEQWQEIRKFVIARDKGRCRMCKSTSNLRVHHLEYRDFYNPYYLVTLCEKCHSQIHLITKHFEEALKNNDSELSCAIDNVNEAISHIIDPFIIERCAELSPDGDIHFFTGPRKDQVNINKFIRRLVWSDPYKTKIQNDDFSQFTRWFRNTGNSSFTRYNEIRMNRKKEKTK